MDYLIPVERGSDWNQERAIASLPPGTRYTIAEHDPGELAEAVTDGVRQSPSELVFLACPDGWVDREPDTLRYLTDAAWNADLTYGPLIHWADGKPAWVQGQEHFCPNRLYRENYIPGVACVRKTAFLGAGGLTSGMWDLYVRMHEQGSHLKYVSEAVSARDNQTLDPSPVPAPKDVLATFYYQATPGTAYWRCLVPARHLPGQAIFNYPVRVQDEEGKLVLPQHAGAAVMQFTGDEAHYLLAKYLKEQGVRVLVEVDDNYAHWFPEHMKRAGWSHKIADTLKEVVTDDGKTVKMPVGYSVECHLETVKIADGVICTTPFLAAQYRKHNENVFVCGNHIDPQDWPALDKPDDGVFRIGWFASGSHRNDGALIEQALRWAYKQPNVEVVMMGVGATSNQPWWRDFSYKHIPWSPDFAVYRKLIQQFDVNLCPVVPTPWAQYRSDLKALEGAMSGALSVVSDVPPYADLEMPHVTRCKTPREFLRKIQWCVANRDLVREQALDQRAWTLEHRTIQKNISAWETAIAA